MSWEAKTDYCGLAVANKLLCKSGTANTTSQYLEKHGANGDYVKTKVFGTRSAPANVYTVADDVTFTDKKLGEVTTAEGHKYALEKLSWSTGADQEPTVDASAQEVKSTATTGNYFALPEFSISPDQTAQIPSFKFPVAQGQTLRKNKLNTVRQTQDRGGRSCLTETTELHGKNCGKEAVAKCIVPAIQPPSCHPP